MGWEVAAEPKLFQPEGPGACFFLLGQVFVWKNVVNM